MTGRARPVSNRLVRKHDPPASSGNTQHAEFTLAPGALKRIRIAWEHSTTRQLRRRGPLEHREEPVQMLLSRGVGMLSGLSGPVSEENENTKSGNAQTGNCSKPWIELLGNNVS